MPQITYETGQAGVQTGAVQYNVQPNLSASRAIQALEKGILGAMQLGGQIRADVSEENYQVAALDQKKRHETFQTEIAGMSYPQRKEAIGKFNEANASLYDEKTKFGRQLSANEAAFQGGITQNLRTEGVEYEYLDNQTSQNNAFLDADARWVTATAEEKIQILAELKATQIDVLDGFDDKFSMKLRANAQTALSKFEMTLQKENILEADTNEWSSALGSAIASINQNGGALTAEMRDEIIKNKLGNISSFKSGEKKNELLKKFDEMAVQAILARNIELIGNKPTYEKAQQMLQNVQDYAKISPKVKGSDTYTKTLNAANSYVNAVNRNDLTSLNSLIVDDGASKQSVATLGTTLLNRGVLSQEDYNAKLFLKDTKMVEKNVTPQIAAAYQNGDMGALGEFMKAGRGGTVATVVTDNLQVELGALVNTEGVNATDAIGRIMEKADMFAQQGIFVNKIDAIDNILKMNSTGGIKSNEDAQMFVETMRQARKHNYAPGLRKEAQADYTVLESWIRSGIPDIAEKFQNYKINPVKVKDEDVLKEYNKIVDNDEWFSKDLTPATNDRFKSALLPGIKALLKAGVDPETVVDIFEGTVETQFVEVSTGMFGSTRVLMPRVGKLTSEDVYKTINKAFNGSNVLPMNVFEPTGNWMVINDKTGKAETYPFAAIEYIGRNGKLPSATPK